MNSEYGSVFCFLFNYLNIEDPAIVPPPHLVWHLLTPQRAASLGEDLNFTVMSTYETLNETTAKKCLLTLFQQQGNLPSLLWVKLKKGFINEVQSFSPTPAHTSQQLNLKKNLVKTTSYI